jgi:hypothetical protein
MADVNPTAMKYPFHLIGKNFGVGVNAGVHPVALYQSPIAGFSPLVHRSPRRE